ncbi:SDR family oxidoreductase [Acidisoma cellulosilytica]|uniref:SDR family oxidoreductase n=1 Tax=Acidisoma cellulosilyticum TaxID=2802395 RepID=A0A963Z265_9PROT|nr:SDR family NAD(P)-dependent oxidoreductase [Acidisoma cellulosilyticum]MCB8881395.1 SDR family oxidoreductase [Acidisoma cellulosilyticum]
MMPAGTARVALITGAGRKGGLGQAIARRLARDGVAVMLHDRGAVEGDIAPAHGVGTQTDLDAMCEDLRAAGADVDAVTGDLLQENAITAIVEKTVARFGRIDILVNNAGIGYLFGPLTEMKASDLDAVLGVNLRAMILATRDAANHMIRQAGGGRIINIASQAGKSGFAFATAYTASKHGVVGFTRAAALELGPYGITVNAICPNHVTTGLGAWQNQFMSSARGQSMDEYLGEMRRRIPLGRLGKPEDMADAVAFLCSDAAGYITAEALNVSGGEEYH